MTGAQLAVKFMGGASMVMLARRAGLPLEVVDREIRWCFGLQTRRWTHRLSQLPIMAKRSSRRWPFRLDRVERFVNLVATHEPITTADLARRFGASRRAVAMACAHLEDRAAHLGVADREAARRRRWHPAQVVETRVTARRVADSLTRDELRALRHLKGHRGSISGGRAFELRISREVVGRLRHKAAVEVDSATGDLQLTTAGHDLLTLRCPDTDGDQP